MNNDTDKQDQEILALLRDYPMPEATAEYYDRALVQAARDGRRQQRNRWVSAGFASAVAAGLAAWMIGGLLLKSPDLSPAGESIPGITMTLEEPRTINLVFASAEALDDATLTVVLPPGVEMSGFPGQREVSWATSLAAGRNLLPLKLIATSPIGGEVLATLRHDDRGRSFRLQINVG